ncbi:MAG: hypothetical protein PVSMB4_08030 [Ktedonobacterales bacterium]
MSRQNSRCSVCYALAHYHFSADGSVITFRCWRHALFYRPVARRALRVALVVGTILFLINQSDVVITGHLTPLVTLKIILTYMVPYSVSTYSALQINRMRQIG